MKQLHAANLRLANLAGAIEGVEAPSTNDYFIVQREIESFGTDLVSQRSFAAALETRRDWNNQLEQSRQHQQNNAAGLNDRTHQAEPTARIAETNVVSNAHAITRVLEGKATLTRF